MEDAELLRLRFAGDAEPAPPPPTAEALAEAEEIGLVRCGPTCATSRAGGATKFEIEELKFKDCKFEVATPCTMKCTGT